MMTELGKAAGRTPRADALRNRERLLASATSVFQHGGPGASLEAVARQAGVGIGTLYRHFPTREALFEAVYRREVDQLVELAAQLRAAPVPVEALRNWLHAAVAFAATKKGMFAALAMVANNASELTVQMSERLAGAVGSLLDRAVASGELRGDVSPEDLLRLLFGMCSTHEKPGWQAAVQRLVDVFLDGMRRRG